MIIINKNAVILVLSLAALVSAAILCNLDKKSEESTVIVVNNPHGIEEKITTVSSECTTSVIIEELTDIQTTTLLSKTTVKSSVVTTTAVSELKQPATEEILYLDINNASFDDLVKLNGIGEHLAGRIISYREEYGGFNNIEELMNVSGIGEKIFGSICDYVYVENPVYYNETEVAEEIEFAEETEVIDEITEIPVEIDGTEETETTVPALTLEDVAPINLNEADIETLILLPYVDENIAEEIIEFRENLKVFNDPPFQNKYEILYIEDLKHKQYLTGEQWSEVLKFVCV